MSCHCGCFGFFFKKKRDRTMNSRRISAPSPNPNINPRRSSHAPASGRNPHQSTKQTDPSSLEIISKFTKLQIKTQFFQYRLRINPKINPSGIDCTPKLTAIFEEYKYNCPICMRYFNTILVSECCKNYICHFCIGDLQKKFLEKRFSLRCPHCNSKKVVLKDVHTEDPLRIYTDAAENMYSRILKEHQEKNKKLSSRMVPNISSYINEQSTNLNPNDDNTNTHDQINQENFHESQNNPNRSAPIPIRMAAGELSSITSNSLFESISPQRSFSLNPSSRRYYHTKQVNKNKKKEDEFAGNLQEIIARIEDKSFGMSDSDLMGSDLEFEEEKKAIEEIEAGDNPIRGSNLFTIDHNNFVIQQENVNISSPQSNWSLSSLKPRMIKFENIQNSSSSFYQTGRNIFSASPEPRVQKIPSQKAIHKKSKVAPLHFTNFKDESKDKEEIKIQESSQPNLISIEKSQHHKGSAEQVEYQIIRKSACNTERIMIKAMDSKKSIHEQYSESNSKLRSRQIDQLPCDYLDTEQMRIKDLNINHIRILENGVMRNINFSKSDLNLPSDIDPFQSLRSNSQPSNKKLQNQQIPEEPNPFPQHPSIKIQFNNAIQHNRKLHNNYLRDSTSFMSDRNPLHDIKNVIANEKQIIDLNKSRLRYKGPDIPKHQINSKFSLKRKGEDASYASLNKENIPQ